MNIPKITLNGKEYTAPPAKFGAWFQVEKISDKWVDMSFNDKCEAILETIVNVFRNPDITRESIIDPETGIDANELFPLYLDIKKWLLMSVANFYAKIPNVEAPEK